MIMHNWFSLAGSAGCRMCGALYTSVANGVDVGGGVGGQTIQLQHSWHGWSVIYPFLLSHVTFLPPVHFIWEFMCTTMNNQSHAWLFICKFMLHFIVNFKFYISKILNGNNKQPVFLQLTKVCWLEISCIFKYESVLYCVHISVEMHLFYLKYWFKMHDSKLILITVDALRIYC